MAPATPRCYQTSLGDVSSRKPFPVLRLIWKATRVSLAPHSPKMTFRKREKNLVLISSVNCDLQVSEQQLAFLPLMKVILCGTEKCKLCLPNQGREGWWHCGSCFSALSTSDWCTVRLCLWCDWRKMESGGRLFVRLRKCKGKWEHLIVAKPLDNVPWASFTVSKKVVVDHLDTWGQSCIVSSYWVKGNKCAAPWCAHVCVTGRGAHQGVKICVFFERLWYGLCTFPNVSMG